MSEKNEWKPIESAPQTGRTLLLGYANSRGIWRTVRGQWMSSEYIEEFCEDPDDVEAGWFETSAEADEGQNCWPINPTHWMPLPAAPGSTSSAPGDAQKEAVMDALAQSLGSTAYFCTRVWQAWHVGTMSADDFVPIAENSEALADAADAVLAAVAAPAAGDALAALRELVECDSLKKRIASMQVCVLETEDDVQELDAMMSDLARRQPAAWDAARAALAAQVPQQGEA